MEDGKRLLCSGESSLHEDSPAANANDTHTNQSNSPCLSINASDSDVDLFGDAISESIEDGDGDELEDALVPAAPCTLITLDKTLNDDQIQEQSQPSIDSNLIILSSDQGASSSKILPSPSKKSKARKSKSIIVSNNDDDDKLSTDHPTHEKKKQRSESTVKDDEMDYLDDEYHVDAITGHKIVNNKILYKIKWTGYANKESSFEPVENLYCFDIWKEYTSKVREEAAVFQNCLNMPINLFGNMSNQFEPSELNPMPEPSINEFPPGLHPIKILEVGSKLNQKICKVQFEGKQAEQWVNISVIRNECIKLLADYMEENINFPEME